jgi:hypothetical protein
MSFMVPAIMIILALQFAGALPKQQRSPHLTLLYAITSVSLMTTGSILFRISSIDTYGVFLILTGMLAVGAIIRVVVGYRGWDSPPLSESIQNYLANHSPPN